MATKIFKKGLCSEKPKRFSIIFCFPLFLPFENKFVFKTLKKPKQQNMISIKKRKKNYDAPTTKRFSAHSIRCSSPREQGKTPAEQKK
jgi:hypothetical protein